MPTVIPGIDHLLALKDVPFQKKAWGLVCNNATTTLKGVKLPSALLKAGYNISCLFSPEHGLSATGKDGASQPDQRDKQTGLPVLSLYGSQFAPPDSIMQELDGILFDLPDIGVRFYTYIWTLSYVMEACNKSGKSLVILDRPNPLSGQLDLAEGPMLDEANLSSFIGRWNIPIRHSLTIGELAGFWKMEKGFDNLDLNIIPCQGWQRQQYFSDTGLTFSPPSPAINHLKTLLTYPALCFLESVNVNEGRGTPYPFQQFGAPWLSREKTAEILNDCGLAGVYFKPSQFRPKSGRYTGQECEGVFLVITDRNIYRPVRTGLGILALLKLHFPESFRWAGYPTLANPSGENHIDLLSGNKKLRKDIEENPEKVLKQLRAYTSAKGWQTKVSPFLIKTYGQ